MLADTAKFTYLIKKKFVIVKVTNKAYNYET